MGAQFVNPWIGFCCGMCGWGFILFEIFMGEAGSTASGTNKYVAASFETMRLIVTVGWSIYPLGYFFGYLMGSVEDATLNLAYNLADFVNKIAFCLAIWNSAKKCTLEKAGEALLPHWEAHLSLSHDVAPPGATWYMLQWLLSICK